MNIFSRPIAIVILSILFLYKITYAMEMEKLEEKLHKTIRDIHGILTAADREKFKTIQALLAKDVNPDAYNTTTGQTPLHWAVNKVSPELVRMLILYGASVNLMPRSVLPASREPLYSPLSKAYRLRNITEACLGREYAQIDFHVKPVYEVIEILEERCALPRVFNYEYELIDAMEKGEVDRIESFVRYGVDVNAPFTVLNEDGTCSLYTPIMYAFAAGYPHRTIDCLLEQGAHLPEFDDGETALHDAVKEGDVLLVQILIKHKADVNAPNRKGSMPLHFASQLEIIRLLLEAGAQVNQEDEMGFTPLHYAQNARIVDLLVQNGALVDAANLNLITPLHHAASLAKSAVVAKLLEKGASANAQDAWGHTPLYQAVVKGDKITVQKLIKAKGCVPLELVKLACDQVEQCKLRTYNRDYEKIKDKHKELLIGNARDIVLILVHNVEKPEKKFFEKENAEAMGSENEVVESPELENITDR